MVAFAPHIKRPADYEIRPAKQPRFLLAQLSTTKPTPGLIKLPTNPRLKLN
jgi:hypothetical protein